MAQTMKRHKGAILLSMLLLTTTLIGGQALGQELDAKGEKELAARGQKIDKSATQADPSRVAAKIVDEWSGTKFKFDATSAPRELTAQDVQYLRAKRLGFGEITILLALTANQPNSTTAKPLYEILALRQSGQSGMGWGKLARELGYKNLGEVMKSVKATEKGVTQVATERSEKPGKAGKPEKPEKLEKPEKMDRMEKPERPEKPGR